MGSRYNLFGDKKMTTQVELEEVVDPSQTPVVIHGTYLR